MCGALREANCHPQAFLPRMPPLADILRESSPNILLTEVCLVRVLIGICYEITS